MTAQSRNCKYLLLSLLVLFLISSVRLYCVSATPPHTTHVLVNASSENCTNYASNLMTTTPYCALTDALWYRVTKCNDTEMRIAFGTYILNSTRQLVFSSLVNFSMVGECSGEECPTIECVNETGLRFINSDSIAIKYLKFQNCGTRYNDFGKQAIAAVVFHNCTSLQLREILFIRSTGTALALINPSDTVNITRCVFLDSVSHSTVYGGGVLIHFSQDQRSIVVLENCHLANNTAVVGGGLCVNFTGKSSQNILFVQSCQFKNNQAKHGGGMFARYSNGIKNCSIVVRNSSFSDNKCTMEPPPNQCYGAAVSLEVFSENTFQNTVQTQENIVQIQSSSFTNNKANYGAGISIATTRNNLINNSITLSKCNFTNNEAHFGFAIYVHATYSQGRGEFINISISNSIFDSNHKRNVTGQGAVYVADVIVAFEGKLAFIGNNGTALTVVGSQVWIISNTMIIFTDNKANLGGAIALLKGATIKLYDNLHINFTNNHAKLKGGAVYASDLYWDQVACPIYHHTSGNYDSNKIIFDGNTVGRNKNSIYMPSASTCHRSDNYTEQPFCWENWVYVNSHCQQEIRTAPRIIISTSNNTFSVFPGESKPLPLHLYDDYNNEVKNVAVVNLHTDDQVKPMHLTIVASRNVTYCGKESSTHTLTVRTTEPRVILSTLKIKFSKCPPGYTNAMNCCECASTMFGGEEKLNCQPSNYRASLYWTWCMTPYKVSNSSVIVAGKCWPYVHPNISNNTHGARDGFIWLPSKASLLDEHFCGRFHRTSTLCSQCIEGYGIPVLSYDSKCVECSSGSVYRNVVKYIAAQYIPLTGFLLLIVLFKISVNNGYANMFVLYAQTLSIHPLIQRATYLLAQNRQHFLVSAWKYFVIPSYGIWNLQFLETALPPFCINPQIKTVHKLALSYIVAMYPLILLAVSLLIVHLDEKGYRIVTLIWRPVGRCLARFHQKLNIQTTAVDAFCTLIVLSYSKVCYISFQLLAFNKLLSSKQEINGKIVLQVDVSVGYLDSTHIPYFITAVVFLSTYITLPPLLLLLYPSTIFQHYLDKLRLRGGLVEALFNSFTGCYKDGANGGRDCRYFAAYYMILRILLLTVVYVIPPDHHNMQSYLQTLLICGTLFLILILKPYRNMVFNYLDTFIVTCTALLIIMVVYAISWYHPNMDTAKGFFFIMSSLPLLYMILLLSYTVYTRCPCQTRVQCNTQQTGTAPCSHRLLHPGEYENLS